MWKLHQKKFWQADLKEFMRTILFPFYISCDWGVNKLSLESFIISLYNSTHSSIALSLDREEEENLLWTRSGKKETIWISLFLICSVQLWNKLKTWKEYNYYNFWFFSFFTDLNMHTISALCFNKLSLKKAKWIHLAKDLLFLK